MKASRPPPRIVCRIAARRPRVVPAPSRRSIYDALTVDRSRFVRLEELVAGPQASAGLVAVGAGYRRRGRLAAARQERASKSTRVCFSPLCSRSERTGRHFATRCCCRGRMRAALLTKFEARHSQLPARRSFGAARPPLTLEQSAFPQRRGPDHARRHGNLRRPRAARPADRDRGVARRRGRASEIPGPARVRRRHQPDPSLSWPHPVPLVSRCATSAM